MAEFLEERLIQGSYGIKEKDESHFVATSDQMEFYIGLFSSPTPVAEITRLEWDNFQRGRRTAYVFFRDERVFWRRLAGRAHFKADDKSLKRYNPQQVNAMITLQVLEKYLVERHEFTLSYYQPETQRREEAIRNYQMESVWLDYSHINSGHRSHGFAKDHNAKLWKIAREVEVITGPLLIEPSRQNTMMALVRGKKE